MRLPPPGSAWLSSSRTRASRRAASSAAQCPGPLVRVRARRSGTALAAPCGFGAVRITASVATAPQAPGRLSTRTGRLSLGCSASASTRASRPVSLPGEKPTRRWISLDGRASCCADTGDSVAAVATLARASAARRPNDEVRRFMLSSLRGTGLVSRSGSARRCCAPRTRDAKPYRAAGISFAIAGAGADARCRRSVNREAQAFDFIRRRRGRCNRPGGRGRDGLPKSPESALRLRSM